MNKAYRVIWSTAKQAWTVVAEKVTSKGGIPALTVASLTLAGLCAFGCGSALALPTDGVVAAGGATISTPSAAQMNIAQSTNRAIINWNSFNIGKGEAVNITQPSSQAALLNRVLGNDPSQIFGSLSANGQVFLVNRSGVLFAPGSSVNVGGLVASSLNIKDDDFMAGNYRFFKDGNAGSVINQGYLKGGFVALLGPQVENSGSIITSKGTSLLGAADELTLNFDAAGLIALKVDKAAYTASAENSGLIEADGGRVILSARTADAMLQGVVKNSGTIQAKSMVERNGEIILEGGNVLTAGSIDASGTTGGRVSITAGSVADTSGSISVAGTDAGGSISITAGSNIIQTVASQLDAQGGSANGGTIDLAAGYQIYTSGSFLAGGATGGSVNLSAPNLYLMAANLDASGSIGNGGSISVGGGWQGALVNGQSNADKVLAGIESNLTANGGAEGTGGQITVWSEQDTAFYGNLAAAGGSSGGRMEVSSRENLSFGGAVLPQEGKAAASLLLDPKNIVITSAGGGMSTTTIQDPNQNATLNNHLFGRNILKLPTGNLLITASKDDFNATASGAAYLFNGSTQALISTLRGDTASAQTGNYAIQLSNGNFVISSWQTSGKSYNGAVTWGNGTTGWGAGASTVGAANSIIGGTDGDQLGGSSRLFALDNGNFVISGYFGGAAGLGSITWVNGTTGLTNNGTRIISTANSLVGGGSANEYVGFRVYPLTGNGNYVVTNQYWGDYKGAATWMNGSTGETSNGLYVVSSANSLVGSTGGGASTGDRVAYASASYDVIALSNGNYLVNSGLWAANRGAITWGNGNGGTTGPVTSANSVVGRAGQVDRIGYNAYTVESNGYAYLMNQSWNGNRGMLLRMSISAPTSGEATAASSFASLVGSNVNDNVGLTQLLANGNLVARNSSWSSNTGAVTLIDKTTGLPLDGVNTISAANSLIGSATGDYTGIYITELTNGNYVVRGGSNSTTSTWARATLVNGTTGRTVIGNSSVASSANSSELSGEAGVGWLFTVKALDNGNYVVSNPYYNPNGISKSGISTWYNGSTGLASNGSRTASTANSLYGSTADDGVGGAGVTALNDGNYLVGSSGWSGGKGAVTWMNGSTGATFTGQLGGAVSSANSLVGSTAIDMVSANGVDLLDNGAYMVRSANYDYGGLSNSGALTWGRAGGSTVGVLTTSNSQFGTVADQQLGNASYTQVTTFDERALFSHSNKVEFVKLAQDVPPEVPATGQTYAASSSSSVSIKPATITAVLNAGTALTLQANNDITVTSDITANNPSGNAGALTLQAGRSILINASITTDNGNFTAIANDNQANGVVNANRDSGAAVITMASGTSINAGTGAVTFDLRPGTGKTYTTSGNLTLLGITAGSLTASNTGPDNGSISLGTTTLSGNLSVTANNAITQSGVLTVGGTSTLTAGSANNITFDNSSNNFTGGVRAVSVNNLTLRDTNALVLGNASGASNISGNLTVTTGGAITQAGALSVTGVTTLAAGSGNNITLNSANNFSTLGITSGRNVSITDSNALILGASTVSGTLGVTTAGAITQSGALTVSGVATFAAGTGNITLNTYPANNFSTARFTTGNNVSITDSNALILGASTVSGTLGVTTAGAITQSGALNVTGVATFAAGAGNDITLNSYSTNNFHTVGITSGKNVSIRDTNSLMLGASTVSGTLGVTTAGAITQSGALAVTGVTTLAAGSGNDITLNSANNFSTLGITSGKNVSVTDSNALILGASTVSGTLGVTTGGALTQSGALNVTGVTTLAAGAGNNITLNTATNNFSTLGITSGNNVSITDANALILGASTVSGTLGVTTAGAITQSGALAVTGVTTLAAGATNDITLNSANNFSTLGITNGKNVSITDSNALILGASTVSGTLGVTTAGAITQSGALAVTGVTTLAAGSGNDITLNSANNFSTLGITSGRNVGITDSNALILGASTVSGTLGVTTAGAITQSGALTVSGVATFAAGTGNAITLNTSTNNFNTVGITSARNISITDSNALSLGAVSSSGTVNIATLTSNLTLIGAISTNNTTTSAVTLNAAKNTAAGTSTGGDIIISGGSISTGAGGRATLYSGSITGSTGLTTLVDAGSGRFRYNSDESAHNYTTALSSGKYAIYRERPTLTIDANNTTVTYGTAPSLATTVTGYKNSDTLAQSISTQASVAVGGTTSTSGNYTAGSHTLTPSAAAGGLGYALIYTTGTLTVNKKSVTATGLGAADKVYDGGTGAVLNTAGASFSGMVTGDILTASASGSFADKNAATGKSVAISGITLGGADAGNYQLGSTTATTTASITPKGLTPSYSATDKVYDATPNATATSTTAGVVGGDTVNFSQTALFSDKNVGAGKVVNVSAISIAGADAANYSLLSSTAATSAAITAKTVTLAGNSNVDKTYDGTVTVTSGTPYGALSGVIGGDTVNVSGVAVYDSANAGARAVQQGGVALSGADAANYSLSWTNGSGTIAKAALTMTANDAAKVISDVDPLFSAQYSGFVNGETSAVLDGISFSRDAGEAAASYALTPSATTANYSITPINGIFTIHPADTLLITVANNSKVYGTALTDFTATSAKYYSSTGSALRTVTLTGAGSNSYSYDDALDTTGTFKLTSPAVAGSDVGNYSVTVSDFTKTGTNFTSQSTQNGNLAITQLGATFSASGPSKVYDGTRTVTSASIAITNKVGADDVNVTGSGLYDSKIVGTNLNYLITDLQLSGTKAGNYYLSATSVSGADGVITAKPLTAAYTAQDKVYDGNSTAVVAGGSSAVVGGDTVTFSHTSALFANKNAGVGKTVDVAGIALGGADAANYSLTGTTATATATISPRALTVTFSGTDKTYDGNTDATVSNSDNRVGGDILTVSSTAASFLDKNAGINKQINISGVSLAGADSGNYTAATTGSATATISPKALAVSGITAADRDYDGTTTATANTAAAVLTGKLAGDNLSVSATGTFADKHVGVGKVVTLASSYSGADLINYSITDQASTTATISPKALTVTPDSGQTQLYDGNVPAPTLTYTSDSLATGDSFSGDLALIGATRNVGSYAIAQNTLAISDGNGGANYSLTYTGGVNYTVTAKPVTITPDSDQTQVYDGNVPAPALTYSNDPLAVGDSISGALALTAATRNVGSYAISQGTVAVSDGNGGNNYSLSVDPSVTYTVTPAPLTITAQTDDRAYNGTTSSSAVPVVTGTLYGSDNLSDLLQVYEDKNVGTGKTLNVTGYTVNDGNSGNNYSVTTATDNTGSITGKLLTAGLTGTVEKVYDGTVTATPSSGSYTLTGLFEGDTVSVSGSGSYDNRNVGTGKTVSVTGMTLDGADAANYALASTTASAAVGVITAKPLTITPDSGQTQVYDGNVPAPDLTYSNDPLPAGDSLSGALALTAATRNAGSYAINQGTVTVSDGNGGANYSLSVDPSVTYAVTPAPLTITAQTDSRAYNGTTSSTAVPLVVGALYGSDNLSGLLQAYGDKNVGTGKTLNVTGYTVNDGNGGNNYSVTSVPFTTGTITPLALTASLTGTVEKVYDGTSTATTSTGNYTLTGLLAGDTVSISSSGSSSYDTRNAGTGKTVSVTGMTLGGADAVNYTLASTTASAAVGVITPKPLTITPDSGQTQVYDGNVPTPVLTYTNDPLAAGDSISGALALTAATRNAGSYAINQGTVAISDGNGGNNYSLTYINGVNYTVTPAPLTITAQTDSRAYDGTTSSSAVPVASGTLYGSDNLSGLTQAYADKNAGLGTKTLNISGYTLNDGNGGNNYSVATVPFTAGTITPLALTASLTGTVEKVYDGTTSATPGTGSYTLSGLITGDSVSVSGSGSYDTRSAGTGKTVSITGMSLGGADSVNYTLASATASGTVGVITPKEISVTGITAADKLYDGTVATTINSVGAVFNGIVSGDFLSLTSAGAFSDKHAGSNKTVNLTSSYSGADIGNYRIIDQATTTASITPKEITVSGITAADKVYDGTVVATVNGGSFNGMIAGDSLTLSTSGAFSDKNTGTGKTVTLISNYGGADVGNYLITGQATTTASISPKDLTVAANNAVKIFDSQPYSGGNGVSYSGFVTGEDPSVLAGSLGYGGNSQGATAVGVYKITPYGLSSSNYSIIFADGSLYVRDSVSSLRDQVVPVQVALTVPTSWDGKVGSESSASGPAVSLGAAGTQVFVSGDGGVQLSAYSRHIFIRNGGVRQ